MNISYIAKKEHLVCQNLTSEYLVVDGYLRVNGTLKAKTISGNGIIEASRVSAEDIRASSLDAVTIICRRLVAERVETVELIASEGAAVSLYLRADSVRTPKLWTCLYDIDEMEVDEVIHPKQKIRGMFRFLLVSSLCAWWMRLTAPGKGEDVEDADYEPAEGNDAEKKEPLQSQPDGGSCDERAA